MADFDTTEQIQESLDSSPFSAFCGFQIDEVNKGYGRIVMRMPMRPEMERLAGSGRTVAVADVDIFNDSGKLIAMGRGTFSVSAG